MSAKVKIIFNKGNDMESIIASKSDKNDFSPIYNIKAVSSMLDLLPVTIRAWERRYGLPMPHRGKQGYRLYSEHDIRTLRWLKHQNDSGMSISQAVKYLNELRANGNDPATIAIEQTQHGSGMEEPTSLGLLQKRFYEQLLHYDEKSATGTLRTAFSLYTVDQVLSEIIESTMVKIGDSWHNGEISIAVEHFSTQFCIQHLMSMLAASAPSSREGVIFAACAPGEMHQIGLLSLVVMLRWRGWDVKYFGQDLAFDRILETLMEIKPYAILISATQPFTAKSFLQFNSILEKYPYEQPLVVYGGAAFKSLSYKELLVGEIVDLPPTQAIDHIEKLMVQRSLRLDK